MLARIYSCAVVGLEGVIVEVEVDTTQGFPGMDNTVPIKPLYFTWISRVKLQNVPHRVTLVI
jgi:hypothetical protein